MGMGSSGETASARRAAGVVSGPARRPLLLAAAAQGLEAAALCVVVVANVIDLASGRSYQSSSAIALIVVELIVAAGVAWVASGLARALPWSRTPAVMTQVFTGFVALWLLEAHRLWFGLPAVLLVIAGLAGILAPASLRALSRGPGPGPGGDAP
jgi:hypothetical protein